MRKAILQVADTGPLESIYVMLSAAGYQCYLPDRELRNELRRIGCDTVIEIDELVRRMGYDRPFQISELGPRYMDLVDLYVDVKAHRNYHRVVCRWPGLAKKILWYRINGGKPEHVVNARGDMGDEVNPPCPVLTPNQWYCQTTQCRGCGAIGQACCGDGSVPPPWVGRSYACWPPFYRFGEYQHPRTREDYMDPICLVHNARGWGYEALIPSLRKLGLRVYGEGSPDGLIQHRVVYSYLQSCLAYVHLKSSDAPGYALYEALAAACPVVCTRRLIWRCRMHDLLIPNKTCLVFDRETHDPLTPEDVETCTNEVATHLQVLQDPVYNRMIGEAGREQLRKVMWSAQREEDLNSLRDFMQRNFG